MGIKVRDGHACPKCGGLVYFDSTWMGAGTNICSACGRSHAPKSNRDSIDAQFGKYVYKTQDTTSVSFKTGGT